MQRLSPGGYTLLEVMLFLAISTVIFAASVMVVQGQAGDSEFRTSVQEVNSQLQQWIDQVQNGYTSNPSTATNKNLECNTTSVGGVTYPSLTFSAAGNGSERGANDSCIFLGKAILAQANANQIYAIPVIGLRADSSGQIFSSIKDTNPIAAIPGQGSIDNSVDLTQTYNIPNGTRVLWAKDYNSSGAACASSCSYLTGFFTSLSASNSGFGTQSLTTAQYPFVDTNATPTSLSVADCIRLQDNGTNHCTLGMSQTQLWPMEKWELCLTNSRVSEYAKVDINSSDGFGATVQATYGKGSPVCA